ncbi:MAG: DNA-directed RNA polymerase subunit beta' [Candidatus Bipolaricaulia bacterium]
MISGDNINRIKIGLASPKEIRSWSQGEVTEAETINYRTYKPEKGGLYAEEIFGPVETYKCACGKYEGKKYEGIKCEKCGVLVTDSSVRRSNMGHIELASPVVHFWFLKGISSPLSRLFGMRRNVLEKIVYYETEILRAKQWIVTASGSDAVRPGEILYADAEASEPRWSQVRILSSRFEFDAQPGYEIQGEPIQAESDGEVELEEVRQKNGESLLIVRVGGTEYPVTPDASLQVAAGDQVTVGDPLVDAPVGERIYSEMTYDTLKRRYGDDAIDGHEAIEEIDSLIFLVIRAVSMFPLKVGDMIWEPEKDAYKRIYGEKFEAHTGAGGVRELLKSLNLDRLSAELKGILDGETSKSRKKKLTRQLEVVEELRTSGNRPQDIVLEVTPVLPPDLRPMIQLDGGKFATTDLNDLYRRIINRNNRLKRLLEMNAPEVIIRNEKRMLQEAVDALTHNEKRETPVLGRNNRPLKSLSETIQGKHGRLRRNLLGKRVDYSGRAVIVVNPKLKLHQCGIPKKMALELFKPFIMHRLDEYIFSDFDEIKNKASKGEMPEVWDIVEELMQTHPVLLNRAPTLHRLGIAAFDPILVDGDAVQIHPLVCPPYNADFDGDQMAVHLPLSEQAIQECREIMAAPLNILSPAHGDPLSVPTRDQIFAFYYLTIVNPNAAGSKVRRRETLGQDPIPFASIEEAKRANEEGVLDLHAPIDIRIDGEVIETTFGRVRLNQLLPEELRDYQKIFYSKDIKNTIMECYHRYGNERTVQLLDDLKELGFQVATQSGLTISVRDPLIPVEKQEILNEAYDRVRHVNEMHDRGLSTEQERSDAVKNVWRKTVDRMEAITMRNLERHPFNPVYSMVISGARGGPEQVKQLAGMRGPMADPSGEIIEMPVTSNFREGLSIMEYFISTHGGRKGAADTALKTANSGYLTRRLVDAVSEVIVKEEDCHTVHGIEIDPLRYDKEEIMEEIDERIYGRLAAAPVVDPNTGQVLLERNQMIDRKVAADLTTFTFSCLPTDKDFKEKVVGTKSLTDLRDETSGRVIVRQDELITPRIAAELIESGVETVEARPNIIIRSPITCETGRGVCQLCYGMDVSKHQLIQLGEAVGIVAAQSIGEPGTQLTMRTFHTGGVAGEDITQGLPRAEELFEARKSTRSTQAEITTIDGHVVEIQPTEYGRLIQIEGRQRTIRLPVELCAVNTGDEVNSPQGIIRTKSPRSGELKIVDGDDGERRVYILDQTEDRVYHLPKPASPSLKTGERVETGTPLTQKYNLEPAMAKRSGKVVEIIESKERVIVVQDEKGNRIKHPIPYGARKQVEIGDEVTKGDKLSTRSTPVAMKAENTGIAVVYDGKIIIFKPEARKEFQLTEGIRLLKQDGEWVHEGEMLFTLDLPEKNQIVIDRVSERPDGIVEITLHYRGEFAVTDVSVVQVGDKVREGDLLSKGVVPPHNLLRLAGVQRTRDYLLEEIQKVYKNQGVDINDKHIEIVIREMLNNVRIEDPGDSHFIPNALVVLEEFNEVVKTLSKENNAIRREREAIVGSILLKPVVDAESERVIAEVGEELTDEVMRELLNVGVKQVKVYHRGEERTVPIQEKRLPTGERKLLRISKSALDTKNFLAAASFQRTTKVLSEAALRGAVDDLQDLKSCVIVSKKIPAGTGFKKKSEEGES